MEFTYYDITFCATWCNKVASMKTCHLMLIFLKDTCSSHSNDNIELASSKSYWVDWYPSNQISSLFFDPLHLSTKFWTGLYKNYYWKKGEELGTQINALAYKGAEPQNNLSHFSTPQKLLHCTEHFQSWSQQP